MGVQMAGTCLQWSQLSPANAPTTSQAALAPPFSHPRSAKRAARGRDRALASPFLGAKLSRARSMELRRRSRGEEKALRRAVSASVEHFDHEDDEAFVRRIEELAQELRQLHGNGGEDLFGEGGYSSVSSSSFSAGSSPAPSPLAPLSRKRDPSTEPPWLPVRPETPDWPDQIVPASVEKNANSVELPLSLRILKRKKRWEEGCFREADESACSSVKRAFSSMVFMIRELQSYTLQMREVLFRENLRGILARVQREMNSSFVWLFQQIFSCTPTLMVSVMLLLANFTVYSMGQLDATAMAAPTPPTQQLLEETVVVDDHRQSHHDQSSIIRTFSSIGGSGAGGGGKTKPVAGATGDERSDDGSYSYRTILPEGISRAPGTLNAGAREEGKSGERWPLAATDEKTEEEEAKVWTGILEEASRIQASTRDEALMDPDTLRWFVSPVTIELQPDDYQEYLRTEIMYQQALSQDPENALLLTNFAQFLHLVLHDHDRAEYYFKRAAALQPADAEALSRYASFLWMARKDLEAAEETYLAAIDADPSNTFHAANYAHFLWNTGGEDTCYPLDDIEEEAE
ncbi:hypothetical protein Cni_G23727 [Canna indica]|uniref:Tetratricopeptide repeat-like superfamily protein n=1 Tax=Canna indica TaxID=4628 RepID=A0AAQ3QJG5_9LILI|nr:hypothetical protein Cni_G23727 [Canna indica]